jgi:hypothetical protein
MTETERDDDTATTEPEKDTTTPSPESVPTEDDIQHNLPGTPDESAEGLVDGVAEGE